MGRVILKCTQFGCNNYYACYRCATHSLNLCEKCDYFHRDTCQSYRDQCEELFENYCFFESLYKLAKDLTEHTIEYISLQNSRSFACSDNLEKEPEDSPNIIVLNKFRECDERLSDIKIKIDERSEKFGVRLKIIHEIQQMFLDLNRLILTYYEDNSSKFNSHKDLSLFGWNKLKKLTEPNYFDIIEVLIKKYLITTTEI